MKRLPMRSILTPACILTALLTAPAHSQTGPNNLTLSFSNLAVLDEAVDGHYEGWAIVNGTPVSTGNFNVDGTGTPVELGGGAAITEFDAGQDISGATAIKITIEPPLDADPGPSGLVIVEGDLTGTTADLCAALPDLATLENSATSAFILATPSDNTVDATNDDEGIWFLTMPGPAPGFNNLPAIGPNWVYEGWVVDISGANPVPYSTGTFAVAAGADSDAAGCNGGGPPFPGQDFVAFHCGPILDLDSGDFVAVISVEPVPDNAASPFQLKPFAGAIPTDALGQNNSIANQVTSTFPKGSAAVGSAVSVEDASWSALKNLFQ